MIFSKSSNEDQPKTESLLQNKMLIFLLSVLLILAVLIGVLLITQRLTILVKSPNERVIVQQEVCGYESIDGYNALYNSGNINTDALSRFVAELPEEAKESSDPNCLFMLAHSLALSGSTEESAIFFNRLESLGDEGIYASGKINSLMSLRNLSAIADPGDYELTEEGKW